jgi:hypothetical protein
MKEKIIEILNKNSHVDMTGYYEKIIEDDDFGKVAEEIENLYKTK